MSDYGKVKIYFTGIILFLTSVWREEKGCRLRQPWMKRLLSSLLVVTEDESHCQGIDRLVSKLYAELLPAV